MKRPDGIPGSVPKIFASLGVEPPYDSMALAEALHRARGCGIEFEGFDTQDEGVYATVYKRGDIFVVVYRRSDDPLREECNKLHELGHIVLGHRILDEAVLLNGYWVSSAEDGEAETFAVGSLLFALAYARVAQAGTITRGRHAADPRPSFGQFVSRFEELEGPEG